MSSKFEVNQSKNDEMASFLYVKKSRVMLVHFLFTCFCFLLKYILYAINVCFLSLDACNYPLNITGFYFGDIWHNEHFIFYIFAETDARYAFGKWQHSVNVHPWIQHDNKIIAVILFFMWWFFLIFHIHKLSATWLLSTTYLYLLVSLKTVFTKFL